VTIFLRYAIQRAARRKREPRHRQIPVALRVISLSVLVLICCLIGGCSSGGSDVVSLSAWQRQASNDQARGECTNAIQLYGRVIAQDSTNVRALDGRGACFVQLGEFGAAISDLEKASQLSPDSSTLMNLANAYWQNGQETEAKHTLREDSLRSLPSNGSSELLSIAETQRSYGFYDDSRATLERIALAFRNYEWYLTMGQVASVIGTVVDVNSDFAQAVSLAPDGEMATTLSAMGDAWSNEGYFQLAIDSYDKSLTATGAVDRGYVFVQLGVCYERLGNLEDALSVYVQAAASGISGTDLESADLSIARVDIAIGNLEGARVMLTKLNSEKLSSDLAAQAAELEKALQNG
jgi:tetratricopeptide (TPR) repeat protein